MKLPVDNQSSTNKSNWLDNNRDNRVKSQGKQQRQANLQSDVFDRSLSHVTQQRSVFGECLKRGIGGGKAQLTLKLDCKLLYLFVCLFVYTLKLWWHWSEWYYIIKHPFYFYGENV